MATFFDRRRLDFAGERRRPSRLLRAGPGDADRVVGRRRHEARHQGGARPLRVGSRMSSRPGEPPRHSPLAFSPSPFYSTPLLAALALIFAYGFTAGAASTQRLFGNVRDAERRNGKYEPNIPSQRRRGEYLRISDYISPFFLIVRAYVRVPIPIFYSFIFLH